MSHSPTPEDDCLFCKIISGNIPSLKVDEDDASFSFLDIAPFHRGHTLVIPKRHVESFIGEPPALAEITPAIDRVSRTLVNRLGADGINLFSSAGAVAGQEVFHLHVHLVPRYASAPGLSSLIGPKPMADDGELETVWREITGS
jgi:histidine triad (HIT) family protein